MFCYTITCQSELFLSEVHNRQTIAAIEANNDTYRLQKRKVPTGMLLSEDYHVFVNYDPVTKMYSSKVNDNLE